MIFTDETPVNGGRSQVPAAKQKPLADYEQRSEYRKLAVLLELLTPVVEAQMASYAFEGIGRGATIGDRDARYRVLYTLPGNRALSIELKITDIPEDPSVDPKDDWRRMEYWETRENRDG